MNRYSISEKKIELRKRLEEDTKKFQDAGNVIQPAVEVKDSKLKQCFAQEAGIVYQNG